MWRSRKKEVAEHILDDKPWDDGVGDCPDPPTVEREYRRVFSELSVPDDEDTEMEPQVAALEEAIGVEEIGGALRRMGSDSAGLDGIKPSHLRKVPPLKLSILFNTMILLGIIPNSLKRNRSILIPKGGDRGDIGSWRPITISSAIIRLLHKVVAERFGNHLTLHANQRGFRRVDGVILNNLTLQALIKSRRANRQPYHLLALDLRKAFDTVSHHSVSRALRRFGIGNHLSRFIMEGFNGATTTFKCGNGDMTGEIPLNRGVRQGDPLSPILFNMVLDELIVQLESTSKGIPLNNNTSMSVMGYADDLIVASDSIAKAQSLLNASNLFFSKRGMSLNANKSVALSINVNKGNKHMYTLSRPVFFVDGQPLAQCQPGSFFKYLGKRYGDIGQGGRTCEGVKSQLARVEKAPLKPHQKLELIKVFLIPRHVDSLQHLTVTLKVLKETDKLIRMSVRRIFHLNRTCQDAFIHAAVADGGLGVLAMHKHVPAILLGRVQKLRQEGTQLSAATLQTSTVVQLQEKLLRWCGDNINGRIIRGGWAEELQSGYSGNGLNQGRQCRQNGDWIANPPTFWSGRDISRAVQLRGNLLPTRGVPSNPPAERLCRAGCGRSESLSHVLQRCYSVKPERIRRHDHLVAYLARVGREGGWTVEVEQRIRARNGLLRIPDLIFAKDDRVVVSDVSVSWEGPDSLRDAGDNKVAIYSDPHFTEAVRRRFPEKTILVAPLIVGARGIFCPRTNAPLCNALALTDKHKKDIITRTIMGSLIIHSNFSRD